MAEIAVSLSLFAAEILKAFLNKEGGHRNAHDEVDKLKNWLGLMKSYIGDEEGNETTEVSKNLVKMARQVAFDIEDIMDKYMFRVAHQSHSHKLTSHGSKTAHYLLDPIALNKLSSRVKDIDSKINQVLHGLSIRTSSNGGGSVEGSSSGWRQEDYATRRNLAEDEIVGYEEERKLLLDLVTGPDLRLATIAVVGLAGSGKSILAKNVYDSKSVHELFHCQAWVNVPRPLRLDELLQGMLKELHVVREEDLRNKRYLVVLDKIWRQDDLEKIVSALPRGVNGSRIIFTCQNMAIASSCGRSSNHILQLNGFTFEDSWKLFCRKAFGSEKCPDELVKLSQQILTRCEGLPFAIAATGSLLSRKNQNQREWIKWNGILASEIGANSELSIISRFLLPSFRDLSSTNKCCLLYFSMFPEDYSVKRERLIRLWVAEGFVKETRSRTAEEVAEDCLNELVERNLVSVSQWEIDRRVRSCRTLNLVRGFIISTAEDHKFLGDSDPGSGEKIRRLSIQDAGANFADRKSWRRVRTSFLFWHNDITPSMIKKMLDGFRLLKVLDLQDASLEYFPEEIVAFKLLRYLSLRRTKIREVPKSIENLSFLETLDLKQTRVTRLPREILKLRNLRHLLAYHYNVVNYVTFESAQGVELRQEIEELCAIQKLTLIKVNKHRGIVKRLGNLIHVRKLGLIGLKGADGKDLCESIMKMQKLLTLDLRATTEEEYFDLDCMQNPPPCLQRLYLKGRLQKLPGWISRLRSVVKIGLKWSRLDATEDPLNTLQYLPDLMELELVNYYVGEKLEFKAKTFKKLKVLNIEQFDQLNTIVLEREAMPILEKLTIYKCKNLKMIPLGISNLSQLEQLILRDMHDEFIAKLRKNSEYREMVEHVKIIHSFTLDSEQRWSFQNLS